MKTTVRILKDTPGPVVMLHPGDVIALPAWLAQRLIARGVAEVDLPTAVVEEAPVKPKRKKK